MQTMDVLKSVGSPGRLGSHNRLSGATSMYHGCCLRVKGRVEVDNGKGHKGDLPLKEVCSRV